VENVPSMASQARFDFANGVDPLSDAVADACTAVAESVAVSLSPMLVGAYWTVTLHDLSRAQAGSGAGVRREVGAEDAGLGAELCGLGFQGRDAHGAALSPGLLALRVGQCHSRWSPRRYVTNVL
jgi:hypothetical protein